MPANMRKRFYEIIDEDARRVAAEWREIGDEDAHFMVAVASEATRKGEALPEPAEQAWQQLRSHMTRDEMKIAWPELLRRIKRQLR